MLTGFVIGDRGLGTSGDTHPPLMMAHARAGSYLVVGASAIGQMHRARNAAREDAFIIRSAGPWLAVAVADGVGSRPHSRYAATYVVEALSAMLLRPLIPLPSAILPNPLDTPDSPSSSPKFGNLAAPSEEGRPDPGQALVAALEHWTESVREPLQPLPDFQQAVSIGWWLPENQTQPAAVPQTHPSQNPTTCCVNSDGEGSDIPADISHDATDNCHLLEIVKKAFTNTHLGLREHARSLNLQLEDLSCTALGLLLNVKTGTVAVGQVGDGAILGLTSQGKVRELVSPLSDSPHDTYTLNHPNFGDYLVRGVIAHAAVDPFVAFYVMTDGLAEDLLYCSENKALADWAQTVDQKLHASPSPTQAATAMLTWLATYVVQGSWDDRTLVVITQRERTDGNCQPVAE
ncbi:hypothetical protein NIES2134_109360 [Thermostichus vulcanus NIES-2134]|nr:hypothetical protein NIES2134_109360 [Thermostichus vulcanus NIES-2134]